MGLDVLLAKLESRATDTPDTPCNPCGVSAEPAPLLGCTPDTPDTPQIGNAERNQDQRPPHLTAIEQASIEERLEERAAIIEHDGGESRPEADAQAKAAMRVYRIRVAMGPGELDKWVTMLAPGCDLAEATRVAQGQFGAARVLQVVEHLPEAAQRGTV